MLHDVASPAALNTSVRDFYDTVLRGTKTPEQLATFHDSWVDVRDVADAHVNALERPEAGGQRFIVSAGEFSRPRASLRSFMAYMASQGNFVWQDWRKPAPARLTRFPSQ